MDTPSQTQSPPRQVPTWRTLARWSLTVFALWLVGWVLWNTGGQLLPFVIGLIFAYLLLPLVNKLARHIPRWAAILLIYVVGLGAITAAIIFVVPPVISQIGSFFGNLPEFYEKSMMPFI